MANQTVPLCYIKPFANKYFWHRVMNVGKPERQLVVLDPEITASLPGNDAEWDQGVSLVDFLLFSCWINLDYASDTQIQHSDADKRLGRYGIIRSRRSSNKALRSGAQTYIRALSKWGRGYPSRQNLARFSSSRPYWRTASKSLYDESGCYLLHVSKRVPKSIQPTNDLKCPLHPPRSTCVPAKIDQDIPIFCIHPPSQNDNISLFGINGCNAEPSRSEAFIIMCCRSVSIFGGINISSSNLQPENS